MREMLGSFAYRDNSLYMDVILTLAAIQDQVTMKTTTRINAYGFIEAFLKYELVLTVIVQVSAR